MAEYIEREAVEKIINQLYQEPKYQHTDEDFYAGVCAVAGGLATLPTADVAEVKHGKWHNIKLITPWVATGICSACKTLSYINPDFPYFDFCPNCGAKMDGAKNV